MHYLIIVGTTLAVYVFVIAGLRLFGKSDLTQLSIFDVVFVMLVSNEVQNAMVGPDTSLLGGLISAATLFVANQIFKWLTRRFPKLGRAMQGHAIMLVYDGKIIRENMRRADISDDELYEAMREHGEERLSNIGLAVLETDGNISILTGKDGIGTYRIMRGGKPYVRKGNYTDVKDRNDDANR